MMKNLKVLCGYLFPGLFYVNFALAQPAWPGAPEGPSSFGPMIGDHPCTMKYRGEDGELSASAPCRWNWYYKFNGHMVQDDFSMLDEQGNIIWNGSTLRTWEPGAERWNNMFLGVHGTGFGRMFHGVPVDGEIHLEVDGEDPDGRTHINRIFFYEADGGAFKWRQERSYDDGNTWNVWVIVEAGPQEPGGNGEQNDENRQGD